MGPVSKPIRLICAVVSAIVLLSSLYGFSTAFWAYDAPEWGTAGFETVIAVASVIGVLFGLGKYRSGPAMALACVAGTFFVGTALGRISGIGASGRAVSIRGLLTDPWLIGRTAAAAILTAAACWCVLSRDSARSVRPFILGVVLGAPVVGAAALFVLIPGAALTRAVSALPGVVVVALVLAGLLVLGGLFSASVHLIHKAFAAGAFDSPSDEGTRV